MTGSAFDRLVEIFMKFPGIGPRQARRFVYFLLSLDNGSLSRLTEAISLLKQQAAQCSRCGYHFFNENKAVTLCQICRNKERDFSQLMVVEKDLDVDTIKKSDSYQGTFFILGGLVPILDKEPERKVRLHPLFQLIKKETTDGTLKEIIIAMSVNAEGDYTIEYLKNKLAPLLSPEVKISVLGRGLSTGTELEYSDSETLKNALKNRA